jgi:gluconate 5-dehydrogenase
MIERGGFRLDGRVALVTGSTSGIGLAIARGLAASGATVVINGRSAERMAAAARTLADAGLPVQQRAFDVADSAAADRAFGDIESSIGPLHIVVNNAGITRRAAVHELGDGDWRSVMATNADAAFYIGRAAARVMLPRKAGRIINVCSIMSEVARPGVAAYSASKGAIKMLTKAMAVELAPHGITVNGIAPGYFRTELTEPLAADPQFDQWITNRTPMRRWGHVDELAPVAVFLASDAASYITGHLLVVDGGMTATL